MINGLNSLVTQANIINLDHSRKISSLSKNLIYISDNTSYCNYDLNFATKLTNFVGNNDTYIEVSAKCGASGLLISRAITAGAIYLFEADKYYYKFLKTNVFLNNLNNVFVEKLEILEQPTSNNTTSWDEFIQKFQLIPSVIRIDNGENVCKAIRGAKNLIKENASIRVFINWQKELLYAKESLVSIEKCLASLAKEKFLFFDVMQDFDLCNYQDYGLTVSDVLKSNNLEFMAAKEEIIESYLDKVTDPIKSELCRVSRLNHNLFTAASNGKIGEVSKYIAKGANIDYFDSMGGTSLYIAAQNGHIEVVRILLQNGANLEIKSAHGLSPLYVAVLNKHINIAELLLLNKASTESSISSGSTPLYLAAYYGYFDVVKLLLKYGANKNVVLDEIDIIQATKTNGHSEIAQLLQNNYEYNNDILFLAAQAGDFTKVAELIGHEIDVNFIHALGATALYIASQNGYASIVELLLQNNANPKICWNGLSPLFMAVQNKHINIVELLLKYGADPEAGKSSGATALYLAVTQEDNKSVELLLEAKADTEVKIGEYTSLGLAVYNGLIEIVRLLIKHGANTEVTIDGFNLLYIAAKRGFTEIAGLLLESGLKINEGQVNSRTVLDVAAEHNHIDTVKFLLAKGANIGKSQKQVFKLLLAEAQAKNASENKYEDNVIEVILKQQDKSSDVVDIFSKLINKMSIITDCHKVHDSQSDDFIEACGLGSAYFIEHYHE